MVGKVKWFNDQRGYGFVTNDNGQDAFIHFSNIKGEDFKTLKEGDEVQYQLEQNDKGPNAIELEVI